MRTEARGLLPLVTWFALPKSLFCCKGTLSCLGHTLSVLRFKSTFTIGGLAAATASAAASLWFYNTTKMSVHFCVKTDAMYLMSELQHRCQKKSTLFNFQVKWRFYWRLSKLQTTVFSGINGWGDKVSIGAFLQAATVTFSNITDNPFCLFTSHLFHLQIFAHTQNHSVLWINQIKSIWSQVSVPSLHKSYASLMRWWTYCGRMFYHQGCDCLTAD